MQQQATLDIYLNHRGGIGQTRLQGGQLVGTMTVSTDTLLQTVAASIYEYLRTNALVTWQTYKLALSQQIQYEHTLPGTTNMPNTPLLPTTPSIHQRSPMERARNRIISILVPNDIYVPEFGAFRIESLANYIVGIDFRQPLRVDIQGPVKEGLSELV